MKTISNFTRIKRTIQQFKFAYPEQEVEREEVIRALNNKDFQDKYVNYSDNEITKLDIDLFEDFENLPQNVQNLINEHQASNQDYKDAEKLKTSLEAIGYTCEYGLCGTPMNLRGIPMNLQKLGEDNLFPRKCSVTGKGMNEGYCIQDGEKYIKDHFKMVQYITDETDYNNIDEAYEDDFYSFTSWEELEEDEPAYNEEGKEFNFVDGYWISVSSPEKSNESELTENDLLEHEVINQLEADFNDQDFDSISEMLGILINNEESKKVLIEYLSDSGKENWIEGRTKRRY